MDVLSIKQSYEQRPNTYLATEDASLNVGRTYSYAYTESVSAALSPNIPLDSYCKNTRNPDASVGVNPPKFGRENPSCYEATRTDTGKPSSSRVPTEFVTSQGTSLVDFPSYFAEMPINLLSDVDCVTVPPKKNDSMEDLVSRYADRTPLRPLTAPFWESGRRRVGEVSRSLLVDSRSFVPSPELHYCSALDSVTNTKNYSLETDSQAMSVQQPFREVAMVNVYESPQPILNAEPAVVSQGNLLTPNKNKCDYGEGAHTPRSRVSPEPSIVYRNTENIDNEEYSSAGSQSNSRSRISGDSGTGARRSHYPVPVRQTPPSRSGGADKIFQTARTNEVNHSEQPKPHGTLNTSILGASRWYETQLEFYFAYLGFQIVFLFTSFVFDSVAGGLISLFGVLCALFAHIDRRSGSYSLTAIVYSIISVVLIVAVSSGIHGFAAYADVSLMKTLCIGNIVVSILFVAYNIWLARQHSYTIKPWQKAGRSHLEK